MPLSNPLSRLRGLLGKWRNSLVYESTSSSATRTTTTVFVGCGGAIAWGESPGRADPNADVASASIADSPPSSPP